MRDYQQETEQRVRFIKDLLADSGAKGVVFGSSGGKDSALVGILCKMAASDTLGVIMPCESLQNYESDRDDAMLLAKAYDIETIEVDLSRTKQDMRAAITAGLNNELNSTADININPRLRMAALYAIAAARGYLVAGTGNKSETHLGYFTKWGDGACDFNPIADLTVKEVFEFLSFLKAPEEFWTKAPSAGLFPGQTDESDMGFAYDEVDDFLLNGIKGDNYAKIEQRHNATAHKRRPIAIYKQP